MFWLNWDFLEIIYDWVRLLWTQLLGLLILILFCKCGLQCKQSSRNVPEEQQDFISCKSPNCVRCRTYAQKSMHILYNEWIEIAQNMGPSETEKLTRISQTMMQYRNQKRKDGHAFRLELLPGRPFYSKKNFKADVDLLENHWEEIYSEYLAVAELSSESDWKVNSTPSGRWSAFYLVNQGTEVEENTMKCPNTYRFLNEMGYFMRNVIFGNACFSVVYPETHIEEHYGPCNLRVRCHLGLDVPEECELVVNKEKATWKKGKCVTFDDSYLHSVTHRGNKERSRPRVILLVDFWNPDLSPVEKQVLSHLLSSEKLEEF